MGWECIGFLDTQDLNPLSHDSHYRRGMARDSLPPFSVGNTAASDLGRPKDCFYRSPEDSRRDREAGLGGKHSAPVPAATWCLDAS